MPARRQLLQKITLNASATTLTFSNIPQTYTDLRLVISARTDRASDTDGASVRFNGDTGTNYSTRLLEGSGSAAQSRTFTSQTSLYVVQGVAGGSSTASTFGNAEAHIPNYTGSTQKAVLSRGTSENNATASWMSLDASLWTGTAAITSITLLPVNGPNFLAGSTFYLYGITQVPVIIGGTETISGGYKVHTFTATSSLRVVEGGPVEYLVVAGGGGGGPSDHTAGTNGNRSGGGGAGGYRSSVPGENSGGGVAAEARLPMSPGSYTVTVGGGGSGTASSPTAGSDSSIGSLITATGGGRGGGLDSVWFNGGNGGSGGGGSEGGVTAGTGVSGQGFAGGAAGGSQGSGGGGGGAGAAGTAGTISDGGAGGIGVRSSITGTTGIFRAGGGGGTGATNAGAGGAGGGGNAANTTTGGSGVANTGGGGGSGSRDGGSGGSGVVIIRYPYITN